MTVWVYINTAKEVGEEDYEVYEDGQLIGRIRLARERLPPIWLWSCTVLLPNPPIGSAATLDDAKAHFQTAWIAFKESVAPEKLVRDADASKIPATSSSRVNCGPD